MQSPAKLRFTTLTTGSMSRRRFLRTSGIGLAAVAAVTTGTFSGAARASADDVETTVILEPGDTVTVNTDVLNLRSGPGLGEEVIGSQTNGATGIVEEGPEESDNYRWYKVSFSEDGSATGWCVGVYLSPSWGGGRPTFTVVDGPVNLRDEPGLSTNVIGTYPTGARGTYEGTGRQIIVDGYEWINAWMENDSQYGYIAIDFIAMDE